MLFPMEAKITYVKAMTNILAEHAGEIPLSQLAREMGGGIDTFLPIMTAARLLGLVTLRDGVIDLTTTGKKVAGSLSFEVLGELIRNVEPVKSVIKLLKEHESETTGSLFKNLHKNDIIAGNELGFKNFMLHWCASTKLLAYHHSSDKWSLID